VLAKKSTAMTPPDLVRQIDAPSRGSERRSIGLGAKMAAWIMPSGDYPQPR